MKPIGDRILAKPISEENTSSNGFIIPDNDDALKKAEVIEIGEGVTTLKSGDKIMHPKKSGVLVKGTDGEELLVMRESDVFIRL